MKNLTELVIIIDRSGSMSGLESDVIGGFNSLIEKQKEEDGETLVSTLFFNDRFKFVHSRVNVKEIKPLDKRSYNPTGCTALLDAIGNAITYVKESRAKLKEDEIPEHTIFSIITDGLENASREFSYSKIKNMIEFQKKCGWDFIFQAANIDIIEEADRLGIDRDMTVEFEATSLGVRKNYKCACVKIAEAKAKTRK